MCYHAVERIWNLQSEDQLCQTPLNVNFFFCLHFSVYSCKCVKKKTAVFQTRSFGFRLGLCQWLTLESSANCFNSLCLCLPTPKMEIKLVIVFENLCRIKVIENLKQHLTHGNWGWHDFIYAKNLYNHKFITVEIEHGILQTGGQDIHWSVSFVEVQREDSSLGFFSFWRLLAFLITRPLSCNINMNLYFSSQIFSIFDFSAFLLMHRIILPSEIHHLLTSVKFLLSGERTHSQIPGMRVWISLKGCHPVYHNA